MKTYEIKIKNMEGSPIVCNTRQRELDLEMKELKKNEIEEWEEKNWLRKAVTNKKGEVLLKREWLRGCIINAAKSSKLIPHFATSKKETYTKYVKSLAILDQPSLAHKDKFEAWGEFVNGNPSSFRSSSKVWKIRPMLKNWNVSFKIMDPFGRMQKKELKELLEYGGMIIGIGDARELRYGRFTVESIKEVN